jgi:uridine kinase
MHATTLPPPSVRAPLSKSGSTRPPPLLPKRADGVEELWLGTLGITSVGAFNQACIVGSVPQIIRVCEGLHEKRMGQIADTIAQRSEGVRIICVAGPSSSGKTTFIKRLTVQLQVDGIHPVGLSLDDYYLDRDKSPLDEKGERDFEAVEALDLPLLREHLRRIVAGEEVKTAHFDFASGLSHPNGGPVLALRPTDVLLLEGIHGLNPRLVEGVLPRTGVFRIFIQPTTALPFDAATRVNASDLRLLRRIVRDRHGRGTSPAANILRWPSVRAGERKHIFPFLDRADAIFDSALVYEPSVIKVFADRYLLEVPEDHPAFITAHRLRRLIDRFVAIYPEHVPPTSILREFIGGSGFEY